MPQDPLHNIKNDGIGSFAPERHVPPGVEWMQKHPYAFVLYGIATMLIIGAIVFVRTDSTPQGEITAWSGDSVIVDRGDYDPPLLPPPPEKAPPPTILEDLSHNDQQIVLPTTLVPEVSPPPEDSFDLQEFIRGLGVSKPSRATSSTSSISDLIQEAYSYIPSGLIAISTPKERSPVQQALYGYGNSVGLEIQAFEGKYPNPVAILTNHAEDRSDPAKSTALKQYATSMIAVGDGMLSLQNPPSEVKSIHEALGNSYVTMGSNLVLVSISISDADFLHAIEIYNKSVEAHTKEFVALATLFSTYEVSFGSGDPGRVFTFTPGGF